MLWKCGPRPYSACGPPAPTELNTGRNYCFFWQAKSSKHVGWGDPKSSKIIKNPPKIAQKSSKNEAWEGPGGSWGWSWSHFGSLGATGRQPLVRWPPFGRPKGSLREPIFDNFRVLSVFFGVVFSKLCFKGVWASFLHGF